MSDAKLNTQKKIKKSTEKLKSISNKKSLNVESYKVHAFIIKFLVVFLFLSIVIEYVSTKNNYNTKPSIILSKTADKCEDIFNVTGEYTAKLSSFYEGLNNDVKKNIHSIIMPVVRIIFSPLTFITGYCIQLLSSKYPDLILLGTLTILLLISSLFYCPNICLARRSLIKKILSKFYDK